MQTSLLSASSLVLLAGLAQGQVQFAPATSLAVGNEPESSVLFDADGDGDLDLAVTSDAPDKISLFTGDGAGNFALAQTIFFGGGTSPHTVAAADLDGDGDQDLAVTLNNVNQVQVVLNAGGTFAPGATAGTGADPRDLALVDVTGDGRADAVVSNRDGNSLSVLVNTGGAFGGGTTLAAGQEPRKVTGADLDGDGDVDLVAASQDTRELSLWFNQGAGTFGARATLSTGAILRPDGVAAADLDGDGDLDLVTSTSGNGLNFVSRFLNLGGGTFGGRIDASSGGINPSSLVAADFDGDGDADVVVVNEDSSTIAGLANDGAGNLGAPSLFATGLDPQHVTFGDFDGNGGLDVVTSNDGGGNVSLFRNQNGGVSAAVAFRNGSGTNAPCYSTADLPVLGTSMTLDIDASSRPAAVQSLIVGTPAALQVLTGFGELLVDPTGGLSFSSVAAVVGGASSHSLAIPADTAFAGLEVFSQAVLLGGGPSFCNALDFVAGF